MSLPAHAATIYVKAVDSGGVPPGDGLTWGTAFTDLQSALSAAVATDEIWVTHGTYKPTPGVDRTATFQLKDGVSVYGGFAGTETLLSERDCVTNVTKLSGDIGFVDNTSDNSYHVVTGSGNNATAVLDGCTVVRGQSNNDGGGMLIIAGSPTVTKVIFGGGGAGDANVANSNGGGMWNSGSPLLTDVTFERNASGQGGGLWDSGSATLTNVTFDGNQVLLGVSAWGGGMYSEGNAVLTNVTFNANSISAAAPKGGGMYIAAGLPTLTNVTFGNNMAGPGDGGGLYNAGGVASVDNCIFWGNTATTDPQVFDIGGLTIATSLFQGGLPAGSTDGGGNILNADPLFRNVAGGQLRLRVTSPAIDVGNDLANSSTTDPDGLARKNGPIDMGAYEFTCPSGVVYVDDSATTGIFDGLSFKSAFLDIKYALFIRSECGGISEIWVAEGTYFPTTNTSRDSTFQLLNGVTFYGGFDGTETLPSQRDWKANPSVLSGDIGTPAVTTDNSFSVVTCDGTNSTAVLDGFTVTAGNADAASIADPIPEIFGGGIINGGIGPGGSPTLTNLIVTGNFAGGGAGMLEAGSATLTNVRFDGNIANFLGGGPGGGMYIGAGSTSLSSVFFENNSSNSNGGGVYSVAGGTPNLTNVNFKNNSVVGNGGGMYCEGNTPTLTNVAFSLNTASNGGGLYNANATMVLTNGSFSENTATSNGGGIHTLGVCTIANTILWANSAAVGPELFSPIPAFGLVVSYSLIQGSGGSGGGWDPNLGADGGSNPDPINLDPRFNKDQPVVDSIKEDLAIWSHSDAMDKGNNAAVPVGVLTGRDGKARIAGIAVDLGAYEIQTVPVSVGDGSLPIATAFRSVYPNPFNPTVTVEFNLAGRGNVQLNIYDVLGRRVRTLINEVRNPGAHQVQWNGRDDSGASAASGVYYVRIVAGNVSDTRKMVLLK